MANNNTYNGPATFIFGDQEIDVIANLQIQDPDLGTGRRTWWGDVEAGSIEDQGLMFEAIDSPGSMATLRIPKRGDADVMVAQHEVTNSTKANIKGSGKPPWI